MADNRFNKKIFSLLIERACGDRSIHCFAKDAGVSYVQLRKLHACQQENPPGKKLIKKLSENSLGGIEYEDWLFAAGICEEKDTGVFEISPKDKRLLAKLSSLSSGQRRTAEEFIDFLSDRE